MFKGVSPLHHTGRKRLPLYSHRASQSDLLSECEGESILHDRLGFTQSYVISLSEKVYALECMESISLSFKRPSLSGREELIQDGCSVVRSQLA